MTQRKYKYIRPGPSYIRKGEEAIYERRYIPRVLLPWPPVDFGGENAYPDAWPWNQTHLPPGRFSPLCGGSAASLCSDRG